MQTRAVRQAELTEEDERRIRTLLVSAFPQHAELFRRQSYWGSLPDWRLLLMDEHGRYVAHAGFGVRRIVVGARSLQIAGVGAVCTAPDVQRRGLGRELFAQLHAFLLAQPGLDFAFLECREGIAGFYEAAGFHRVHQAVRCLDPDSGEWEKSTGPKMVKPVGKPLSDWPQEGLIDLRGMPW